MIGGVIWLIADLTYMHTIAPRVKEIIEKDYTEKKQLRRKDRALAEAAALTIMARSNARHPRQKEIFTIDDK